MEKFIKPLIEVINLNDDIICTSQQYPHGSGETGEGGDEDIID